MRLKSPQKRPNILLKGLVAGFIILINIPQVHADVFTDISYDHPYNTAVSYLKSYNIVEGYDDGSFKPDQKINRVEFLKIVLEGTKVPLNISSGAGFTDVDENQWYGPYIKKAKYEGWIQGYPDGSFQPTRAINKVEALKILGEVQAWDRLALGEVPEAAYKDTFRFTWYSPYVYFAKENGLLIEETDYLNPGEEISRGYMAQLMYLSIVNEVSNYTPEKSVEDQIANQQEVATPTSFALINSDFFDKIKLTSDIPNTFYKNEIYLLEGEITDGENYDVIFAFLSQENGDTNRYTHLIGTVSGKSFRIPLVFRESGEFSMGIIPGRQGESKIVDIKVLDGIPVKGPLANTEAPSGLTVEFENDTTTVKWNSAKNNVFLVHFIQDDKLQTYFVRGKDEFNLIYNDFWKFDESNVAMRVYGAQADNLSPINLTGTWSKSSDKNFAAVMHHYRLSMDETITYTSLPEILNKGETIYVSGNSAENMYAEGAVILPSGNIDFFDIQSNKPLTEYYGNDIITAGSSFNFSYTPKTEGIYILELNNQGGAALLNIPVYVGDIIPLIPDFFDLQDPLETTHTLNLTESRNELLSYINDERASFELSAVTMKNDLNALAQNHSDDMVARNYFSHINPEGQSPNDRRIEAGISTDVGENLAQAPTVYFGHKALMRSAIHRKNILNPTWATIGIGLALNSNGSLFITEEFSHEKWSSIDLLNFETDILNEINNNRANNLVKNGILQDIARNWSQDMIDQNFFSFVSPSGINLIDVIQQNGILSEGKAYILKEGSIISLLDKLINESDILQPNWHEVGIGIKQDIWSNLSLTVIYVESERY